MSNIIKKPFSWANKIVHALFKGAPNLITTSDLNRQIEALKKEMYVLQQSSTAIISDLEASFEENTLSITMSYVFCLGVRFEFSFDLDNKASFNVESPSGVMELRMYAKRELITYADDFTKEISGAKFADGTTQPAADHYVYTEPTIKLVSADAPDDNFKYADNTNKEYICTLLRIERAAKPSEGSYPCMYYVQKFTIPMGKGIVDMHDKRGRFEQFELATKDNVDATLIPNANDDWKGSVHKLWSRLYTLEKRLFMDTLYGKTSISQNISVNGQLFDTQRHFYRNVDTGTSFGHVEIDYNFHIVGNICFAAGHITIEKSATSLGDRYMAFLIGDATNEMPHALYYTNSAYMLNTKAQPNDSSLDTKGMYGILDCDKLIFHGLPIDGITFYWSVAYCFSSETFWKYSKDDRYGLLNDIR